MGGEHSGVCATCGSSIGSSPRGRGTPSQSLHLVNQHRIIPAWAGNTSASSFADSITTDHPRVGGEHLLAVEALGGIAGSSPRGRGTPYRRATPHHWHRIIPAWAGNTVAQAQGRIAGADHPRVGGEHKIPAIAKKMEVGSSPRGRGTLFL